MSDDARDLVPGRPRGHPITIDFEGEPVRAFEGESVAAALFAAGITMLARSSKYHRPRGAFCLDGHCGACLMRIDGQPNRRACAEPARAGLRCARQNAFPSPELDLLEAADWLFPEGMDHHTLMTRTRLGNELFLKVVRQMGGSGTLPDQAPDAAPPVRDERVDVCVIGGGPAGLSAARGAAEYAPGARVVLFDEQPALGGSLLAEPGGTPRANRLAAAARAAGVRLVSRAAALAFYPEDGTAGGPPGILAVRTPGGLARIAARRTIYATGTYDQNLPFVDNDRPGIISARACGRLAFHLGIRPVAPRRRVLIIGPAPEGENRHRENRLAPLGAENRLAPSGQRAGYGDAARAALENALTPPGARPRGALEAAHALAIRLALGLSNVGVRVERLGYEDIIVAARGSNVVRGLDVREAGGTRRQTRTDGGREVGGTRRVRADLVAVAAVPAPASELARQHGAAVAFRPESGGFVVVVDGELRTTSPGVLACGDVTGYLGPEDAEEAGFRCGRSAAAELTR